MQPRTIVDNFSIEQIVPFFQPIFDLSNGKVVRYECLSRLVTTNDNVYLPSDFMYIVNRSQSNAQLTQRILELSSAYCEPRSMRWSINMFQTDLRDAKLVAWMQELFKHAQQHLVGVELGFDSVKSHSHLLRHLMLKLPNLHVTVDDVYECESDLTALIEAGIHAVKLRGDSVTRYAKTGQGKLTIESIQSSCAKANCALIAEHIEDDNTLDAVTSLGIEFGQGFYLSQPEARIASLKQV